MTVCRNISKPYLRSLKGNLLICMRLDVAVLYNLYRSLYLVDNAFNIACTHFRYTRIRISAVLCRCRDEHQYIKDDHGEAAAHGQ
jgi:hypothetical protein